MSCPCRYSADPLSGGYRGRGRGRGGRGAYIDQGELYVVAVDSVFERVYYTWMYRASFVNRTSLERMCYISGHFDCSDG